MRNWGKKIERGVERESEVRMWSETRETMGSEKFEWKLERERKKRENDVKKMGKENGLRK